MPEIVHYSEGRLVTDGGQNVPDTAVTPTGTSALVAQSVDRQFPRGFGWVSKARVADHKAQCWTPAGAIVANALYTNSGKTIETSADLGLTWTAQGAADPTYSADFIWRTKADTYIANCAGKLYRSTDLVTWTMVLDLGQTTVTALAHGFTFDPVSGNCYVGAYSTTVGAYPSGNANVYVSTDDGATWSILFSFPSSIDGGTGAFKVRHIHGCYWLNGALYVATGDNGVEAAIWQWNGSTMVRQTPSDAGVSSSQQWRAVWLEYRNGYFYWAQDTGGAVPGALWKAAPGAFAAATKVASLPMGSFYSGQLSTGTILFTTSAEGGAADEDQIIRLYALDASDNLYQVWSTPKNASATGSNYGETSVNGVHIDANDNVLLAPRFTDWTDAPGGTFTAKTIVGQVARGATPAYLSSAPAGNAVQPLAGARTWEATATTSSPTTTSTVSNGSAADVPEMTLTIDVVGGVTYAVDFSGMFGSTAGANSALSGDIGISLDGAAPAAKTTRWITPSANGVYVSLSARTLWTPASPGRRTVKAKWWVAAGLTLATSGLTRTLTVTELARGS